MMKKYFNKKIVMANKDDEDFKDSTNCQIYGYDYVNGDVKVRNHCHITKKYRASGHNNCNINFKLNHKIPVAFHNLKNYDSHPIMLILGYKKALTSVIRQFSLIDFNS